ncbi:uncharacterized protein CDV56_106717 [Aspergillus thermomutatus]|uniref:Uncharacterized protein n=1 Tax=Aspergillus thermomutatus TaxID=41047 RepID=A0A397HWD7_ASPTH|nr:uncharacterized protein CDV56_106717 [Aspergillus thermomutatus]RHZ64920.1 hypothetical protein CDV56_106717 [Aspergillus thermomutatus]
MLIAAPLGDIYSSLDTPPPVRVHVSFLDCEDDPKGAYRRTQYLFLTRTDLDRPGFEGPNASARHGGDCRMELHNPFLQPLPFVYDDAVNGKKAAISEDAPVGHFRYIHPAKLCGLYPRRGALIPGTAIGILLWNHFPSPTVYCIIALTIRSKGGQYLNGRDTRCFEGW